jgi:hypothetical protein
MIIVTRELHWQTQPEFHDSGAIIPPTAGHLHAGARTRRAGAGEAAARVTVPCGPSLPGRPGPRQPLSAATVTQNVTGSASARTRSSVPPPVTEIKKPRPWQLASVTQPLA